jgi:serine/threonine-protein kinase
MLSGRKPFEGESTSDVIASIIQSDPPPVSRFNTAVPGEVDRIIEKCLEKDRDERYQTAAHLLVDLKHAKKAAEGVASRSEEETEILQSDRATKLVAERPTADERSLPATPRRSTYVIVALTAVAIIAAVGAAYWFLGGN